MPYTGGEGRRGMGDNGGVPSSPHARVGHAPIIRVVGRASHGDVIRFVVRPIDGIEHQA